MLSTGIPTRNDVHVRIRVNQEAFLETFILFYTLLKEVMQSERTSFVLRYIRDYLEINVFVRTIALKRFYGIYGYSRDHA